MILVTGSAGYIGTVMMKFLKEHSLEAVGLDCNYYHGCEFYKNEKIPFKHITKDIRDINEKDLRGISAIIHLAALSNDPLGEMNPSLTHEINYVASVRLAKLAKKSGVKRFIFSSSCSLYGISPDDQPIKEHGQLTPITAYAKSKVEAEQDISGLADSTFHPIFMRNATVYGLSGSMRLDLVVNNLSAWGFLNNKVAVNSDGTPWRPLIHVEDVCRAFIAAIKAPPEIINNQAFNVGLNAENYQVKEIARQVKEIIPGCQVKILNKTGPDERTYRVDFSKIRKALPEFKPIWSLKRGVEELYQGYENFGLTQKDFKSPKFFRMRWMNELIRSEKLDNKLKWKPV